MNDPATGSYLRGCLQNFLSITAEDGYIPYVINAEADKKLLQRQSGDTSSPFNICKPLLVQMAGLAAKHIGDWEWVRPHYAALESYISLWEREQLSRFGLFVWRPHRGSGSDNHPAVYGRPLNSSEQLHRRSNYGCVGIDRQYTF